MNNININTAEAFENLGFTVIQNFITATEQASISEYLLSNFKPNENNMSIAQRSRERRAGNIIALSHQRYGHEYYLQSKCFQLEVDQKGGGDGSFSRTPSDR